MKKKEIPQGKSRLQFFIRKSFDYYSILETQMILHFYLIILGGKIIKGEIVYATDAHSKPKIAKEFKEQNKGNRGFDFNFPSNQKRRLDEYDDLFAYISNNRNYLITTNDKDQKVIEEINFGIIDINKIKQDQKTSSNVWISTLDKSLSHLTSKKLNLAYFENQIYYFWMDLNQKYFFDISEFQKYEKEVFPHLKEEVILALNQIVLSSEKTTKKGVNIIFLYNLLKKYLLCFAG